MAYDFYEIPSFDGKSADLVYADPLQPPMPAFVHYGYAVGSTAATWTQLTARRAIPFVQLRTWSGAFPSRYPELVARLQQQRGYVPGESVLRDLDEVPHFLANTAMRLGALELAANIFSGRVTASDKDPFPHQLALQQFMRAKQDHVQRVLIADEVGLGKTIEIGLVLRDLLVARGTLDDFSCVYLTSGGLVEDAAQKLRSVLKGALGDQNLVDEVESFVGFGRGNARGVHVASMHAARLYTGEKKQRLEPGVRPDILIIDECHHCASDTVLAGATYVDRRNATLTYTAAHQMIDGQFWPDSHPPRLVILMSATPFRNTDQFANLLRLLTHNVDGFDAYKRDVDAQRLIDELQRADSRTAVVWRRQDDKAVHSWRGGRLFPNLRIVRPHRNQPGELLMTPEYLSIIGEIRTAIRDVMRSHNSHFGGFAVSQLEKKLTSSSIAGACYIFSWCVRHSAWSSLEAFRKDVTVATENLRRLLIEISQRLATFDRQSSNKHSEVYLPSEGFRFKARDLAQGGAIPDIYKFRDKLEESEDNAPRNFLATPEEIERITEIGLRLLRFSQSGSNGVENAKLGWLEKMLEDHPESRFLVFTESLQTCAIVQSAMPRHARTLTGEMGGTERDEVVAEFRNPKSTVRVLVATSAADEGFDLQVANRVVHWDLSPSPAVLMQRNGRVARLGQISDVTAYYLILPGTHEEKRDSALLDRFGALGIDDVRLQLKILGTLTEEEQARLEEAIEENDTHLVGRILAAAQRGNEEMDRRLDTLSTELGLVSVMDRDQLATRLEAWDNLGLPDHLDIELSFSDVPWQRPVFGEQTTLEDVTAHAARIEFNHRKQEVTFDPEFKVFSAVARHYELAGLRPWTRRESSNQEMKIRPDEQADFIGALVSSLARLPHADFATLPRAVLSARVPAAGKANYLLFVTHPMREAETIERPLLAPYLTFYAFDDDSDIPMAAGTAAEVHEVISLLEVEASVRAAPRAAIAVEQHQRRAERLRGWVRAQTHLGAASLFEQARYALPIPVALIAIVGEEIANVAQGSESSETHLMWSKPCVAMFEFLIESDPARLIRLIDSGTLEPADLTFAAEIAGRAPGETSVESLLRLLVHPSPVVREGAVYGLSRQRSRRVEDRLRELTVTDPSPGVREAAIHVLEDE